MEYIIADRNKARNWGFSENGHIVRGTFICLNEKEVMNSQAMSGTLEERAKELGGLVSSVTEAKMIMNNSN